MVSSCPATGPHPKNGWPRYRPRVAAAILVLGVLTATTALALDPLETHMTPPSQPPIQAIEGRDLTPVKELFNREADHIRVLVLLSPT